MAARNLTPKPNPAVSPGGKFNGHFNFHATGAYGAVNTPPVQADADSPTGQSVSPYAAFLVGVGFRPGRRLYVHLDVKATEAGQEMALQLTPGPAASASGYDGTFVTLPTAGWQSVSVVLECEDVGWTPGAYQAPIKMDGTDPVYIRGFLCEALARIRTDEADTPLQGYYDGDSTDPEGWSWTWEGTPHNSPSLAVDVVPPPAPAGLTFTLAGTTALVEWPDVVDPQGGQLTYGVSVDGAADVTVLQPAYTVAGLVPGVEVEVRVRSTDPSGNQSDYSAPLVLALPATDPEPDPQLDPWAAFEAMAAALAPRCAAYVGRAGDPEAIATAQAQIPVVAEYVRGYTRGRGWTGDIPAPPLTVVIVSAAARLVTNPEQVQSYTTGDYTERPAVLSGWTLAELGVLRRYRRTQA